MERKSASSADTLDQLDTPTFTCEVCKISVRSAQKLLDHVNFSPLHQASLGLGNSKAGDGAKCIGQMRRLLYDGSKLFWRINETLDLCIYEEISANCVTIRAFKQKSPESLKDEKQGLTDPIPALAVDLRRLRHTLGLETATRVTGYRGKMMYPPTMSNSTFDHSAKLNTEAVTPAHSSELITNYILARLQAHRDTLDRVKLTLQKVNDDETDPIELLIMPTGSSQVLPTDLAIRRRHTIDDVKEAQREVSVAAMRLKNARIKAEELSNLARKTLDLFSRKYGSKSRLVAAEKSKFASSTSNANLTINGSDRRFSMTDNKSTASWMQSYDHVVLQDAVERSEGVIPHVPHQVKMESLEE